MMKVIPKTIQEFKELKMVSFGMIDTQSHAVYDIYIFHPNQINTIQ